jgi:hypothetical protein
MRALATAALAAADERAPAAVGRLTGLAYALKTADLRSRVVDVTRSSYEIGAHWLSTFEQSELPLPPDRLVRVLHALSEGLIMQRILTPELCPDEVSYAAFDALSGATLRASAAGTAARRESTASS